MKKTIICVFTVVLVIVLAVVMIACTQPEDITGDWYGGNLYGTQNELLNADKPRLYGTFDKLTINADGTALLQNTVKGEQTQFSWRWDRKNECWIFESEDEYATFTLKDNGELEIRVTWEGETLRRWVRRK